MAAAAAAAVATCSFPPMRSGVVLVLTMTATAKSGVVLGLCTTSLEASPAAVHAAGTSRMLWLHGCNPLSWMTALPVSR
jgi:hypothetical protein